MRYDEGNADRRADDEESFSLTIKKVSGIHLFLIYFLVRPPLTVYFPTDRPPIEANCQQIFFSLN
jgi:hypothetical protein